MAEQAEQVHLAKWKWVLFWLVLAVGTYALLDLGAILYLRAYNGYDGKHLVQYEFDPYKNILPTRNYRDTRGIQHNSVGFRRDKEVSVTPPPHALRIFLMGASTAYGLGGLWPHLQRDFAVIKNSQTIDAYLERELAQALPDRNVEVINAAITSTWTHHHLIYLNQTILKYHPDMVIFLDGFNDHYFYDRGHDQFANYAYQSQANGILGDPTVGSLLKANGWWAYRASSLVYVSMRAVKDIAQAVSVMRARASRKPMDVPDAIAGLHSVFPANALRMVERNVLITRSEGIMPVVMLQPMLILERNRQPMPAIERKLFEYNVASYLPGYEDFIRKAVPWVSDTLGREVRARGGMFLDATGIYEQTPEQVFTDYAHLTPHANEVMAKFIAANILPVIRAGGLPAVPASPQRKAP